METFVGDTPRLSLRTGIDLSGYGTLEIKFRRPNRTDGSWDATIDPLDDTIMYYDIQETDLNMPGIWAFEARASDVGVDLHGLPVEVQVLTPLPDTTTAPTTVGPTTSP